MMLRDDHYRAIRDKLGEHGRINGISPNVHDGRRFVVGRFPRGDSQP